MDIQDYTGHALRYHGLGATVLPVNGYDDDGSMNKACKLKWKHRQGIEQTEAEVRDLFSNRYYTAYGICILCGNNDWRCIDIDKMHDDECIDMIMSCLNIGSGYIYPWITMSGSGTGAHIWFRCAGDPPPSLIRYPGQKPGVFRLPGLEQKYYDHIELRWYGALTTVPPSMHPSGKRYEFFPGMYVVPNQAPDFVDKDRVASAFLLLSQKPAPARAVRDIQQYTGTNEKYIRVALENELSCLRQAVVGSRNHSLYESSLKLGSLVPVSDLRQQDVEELLLQAALDIGLDHNGSVSTIRSGMTNGMANPRQLPEPKPVNGSSKRTDAVTKTAKSTGNGDVVTDKSSDKNDSYIEIDVLAHILHDPNRYFELPETNPNVFANESCRAIFTVITELVGRRQTVTKHMILHCLHEKGLFEVVKATYSVIATSPVAASYNLLAAYEILSRNYRSVAAKQAVAEAVDALNRAPQQVDEILSAHISRVQDISTVSGKDTYTPSEFADSGLADTVTMHERLQSDRDVSLKTQFPKLDDYTGGFGDGETILIAGKTSSGKTAFAVQLLEHFALNKKIPVGFVSLEMDYKAIFRRMAASRHGLDMLAWKNRAIGGDEIARYKEKFYLLAQEIKDADTLHVNDCSDMTPPAIESIVRRWIHLYGIKAVLIDYLGFVRAQGRTQEEEYASAISQLRASAKKTKIPHIVLAQLNRTADSDTGDLELKHIRGSGRIDQDCNTIIFLQRQKDLANMEDVDPGSLIVAKSRDGAIGKFDLQFRKRFTRWEMPETRHDFPDYTNRNW